MVVITDSANRKWGLSVANDQLMDVLGTLLPFAYGVAAFASGVWHIVNITIGSESGVSWMAFLGVNIRNSWYTV